MFTPAVKYESKLRLALAGPPGSGKTFTALTVAHALSTRVAVIDTEHGSVSKVADQFPPFDVVEFDSFHPDRYVEAIHAAELAGYGVLVIDSLSHAWNGAGGILEIVDAAARRMKSANSFAAWAEATPIHTRLMEAIAGANLHVIATMRSKVEYAQERDEKSGKTLIRKLGMAPVQRDGVEYEFDVYGDLDEATLIIQKSRCPALVGAIIHQPGVALAETLKAWLSGAPPLPDLRAELGRLARELDWTEERFRAFLYSHEVEGKVNLSAAHQALLAERQSKLNWNMS